MLLAHVTGAGRGDARLLPPQPPFQLAGGETAELIYGVPVVHTQMNQVHKRSIDLAFMSDPSVMSRSV
eukprot:7195234-Pyramimonas_sp.AAC.1